MKDVFFSPYRLTPRQPLNSKTQGIVRHGALLKVIWNDGLCGYADLHPWEELGDQGLSEQLRLIGEGRWTPLSYSSLSLARKDAEFRLVGKNLLPEKGELKNNALISSVKDVDDDLLNTLKLQGFDTVKIKLGGDLKLETHQLRKFTNTSFRLRFDFNSLLSEHSYSEFMSSVPKEVRDQIEYVEDPFPYDSKAWARARKWAPLAVDQDISHVITHADPAFDVLILKPAKSDVTEVVQFAQKHRCKVAVTSYMDHVVGVLHAASVAHELFKEYGELILESGCLTHHLFEESEFSEGVLSEGPYLYAGPGVGVGFNSQLEALSWQKLARL